jgi:[ribosomal protein S18]-alanine N-acetyltransferase
MNTGAVTIEDVALDDLESVDAVMARAFDARFGEAWTAAQCLAVLTLPGYAVRIASHGGKVRGFSIIRHVADESELLLLAVDPPFREAGIGSALLGDWFAWARERGVTRHFLEMRVDNPARRLYEHFGFVERGVRKAYYRGKDAIVRDAVTMERTQQD